MQQSCWDHPDIRPDFPPLSRDISVDVVVIGAGITGVTAAYLLKLAGATVALVDKNRCGSGETYCTTAHLTYVTDTRLSKLVANFGRDHAQAAWHAGDAAILQIDENIQRGAIDCDFEWVPAYLHASLKDESTDERSALQSEAQLATELGFSASFVDFVPLVNRPGIRYSGQAQFHPLKYIWGLVKQIPGEGSGVFENTEVGDFDGGRNIHAGPHRLQCRHVVLATHVPLSGKHDVVVSNLFQSRLAAFNSYAIGARLPADSVESVLLWDTSTPYYYLRTASVNNNGCVIFGGEDHKTGQSDATDRCFDALERRLHSLLPEAQIEDRWSGQVIETNDGLPFIGELAPHQFMATGYGGNGMTFGTLAAMMARDTIVGISNPWRELFQPNRTSLAGTWNYLKENMSYPYYMLRDRLTKSQARPIDSVSPGEGCLLNIQGQVIAVYRDDVGQVTQLSPVCPHMGCFVHWNNAERTWDCPCHGSRFLATGEVHAGPARSPLAAWTHK